MEEEVTFELKQETILYTGYWSEETILYCT